MGKNFRETLKEQLKDPEFKAEWTALKTKRQVIRAIIEGYDEHSPAAERRAEQKELFP